MRGPFGAQTPLFRIVGARHGKWLPDRPYTSGVTNLLMLDGHVESEDRAGLPNKTDKYVGDRTTLPNGKYIWTTRQQ